MLLFREARCRFYNTLILLADVEQSMGTPKVPNGSTRNP